MDVTRECISCILELREILLSIQIGFNLINAAVVCAILESISGLEPSSVITLSVIKYDRRWSSWRKQAWNWHLHCWLYPPHYDCLAYLRRNRDGSRNTSVAALFLRRLDLLPSIVVDSSWTLLVGNSQPDKNSRQNSGWLAIVEMNRFVLCSLFI